MSAEKVIKAIKRHSKFLITSHINLEGDALGSELALASLLRKMGKQAYIVNAHSVPSNYSFLPGTERIYHKLNRHAFQVAFIIDCPNKERIGSILNLIDDDKLIVNIDHHVGNQNFGKINWIDLKASSTGEMIFRLFELAHTKLNRKDALNIYTAILTDTGSFRHCNTTSTALWIASDLLKFGIEPAKTYARIYENNFAQDVILAAKINSRMSFAVNHRIAWVKIGKPIFKSIKGRHEVLDKVLDFAKSISTVKIVIILCQQDKHFVKLSLRSKSPIDVQKIAQVYGGGGHKRASGCTIKASLKEAEQKILKQAKKALAKTL